MRKYVYERYEQDYLPENCKEGGDLCVAEGDEALLTGVLSAHEENRRHVYSESPHGQVRKLRLRGEYHDWKLRKEHADGPEQSGVCQAAFQEKGEAFLYAVEISRAVVEADYRLSALSKPLKREKGELHDAGQNGHGPHGGVAAVFQQGGIEAEYQQAFGGLHDEGSDTEGKAGRENVPFYLKILFLNAKNGDVSGEEFYSPQSAQCLGYDGGESCAFDSHVETEYENRIENNVCNRADDYGEHADFGKALS